MERSMDLIRDLLLGIEANPHLDGNARFLFESPEEFGLRKDTYSLEQIAYHLRLLIEAHYVDGSTQTTMPIVRRLTWQGHEFLDNIRDNGVWGNTKKRLAGLPSVALGIVAEIAKAEIKKHIGLP